MLGGRPRTTVSSRQRIFSPHEDGPLPNSCHQPRSFASRLARIERQRAPRLDMCGCRVDGAALPPEVVDRLLAAAAYFAI
jgi:hypothetical protein